MDVRAATSDEYLPVIRVLDAAMLATEEVRESVECGDALVAVEDGRVVGALVLDPRDGSAHVEAVAVRRARRGQGIGTALVEAVAERADRLTAEFDPDVLPFYEALDFEIETSSDADRLRGTRH